MKKKILTLLVSRFNCPHRVWNDRTIEEYNSWLQLRLDLFSRYTLKSYKNLNTKPDSWILLVQREKLSNQTIDILNKLLTGEAYQLVEYNSSVRESILKYLENTYKEDDFPEEIRTTRLDTDDLISRDFFDEINSVVLEEDTTELLISFPGGANYEVNTGLFYYSCHPNNPFLTLCQKISKFSELKCIYDENHLTFHQVAQKNLYMRSFGPMWCSIIHEDNLSNQSLKKKNIVALKVSEWYAYSSFGIEVKSIGKKNKLYAQFLLTIHKIHNVLRPKFYLKKGIKSVKRVIKSLNK